MSIQCNFQASFLLHPDAGGDSILVNAEKRSWTEGRE